MKKLLWLFIMMNLSLSHACQSTHAVMDGYQIGCAFSEQNNLDFKDVMHSNPAYVIKQANIEDGIFDVIRLTVNDDNTILEVTKNTRVLMTMDDFIDKYVVLEANYFTLKKELIAKFGEPVEVKEVLPFPDLKTGVPVFYSFAEFHNKGDKVSLFLLSGNFQGGNGSAELLIAYASLKEK